MALEERGYVFSDCNYIPGLYSLLIEDLDILLKAFLQV